MLRRIPIPLTLITALAALIGGCGEDAVGPSGDGGTIESLVDSATLDESPGLLRTGDAPRAVTGGPTVTAAGHRTVVNGGTATLLMSASEPIATVYVSGSAPISGLFAATTGYFELALPAPATAADVLLTFPQSLPAGTFDLYVSAADPDGNAGPMTKVTFNALHVGTGDVQVTVNWDTDADVDLHVIDPSGYEIFWGARSSPSGGQLDLDSNAACNRDGVSNENVTWGVGTAPDGTYVVRVDYWSACSTDRTNYTVLVNNGGDIQIHHGTFTGPGDNGGPGSGVQITTFTRTAASPAPSWR